MASEDDGFERGGPEGGQHGSYKTAFGTVGKGKCCRRKTVRTRRGRELEL